MCAELSGGYVDRTSGPEKGPSSAELAWLGSWGPSPPTGLGRRGISRFRIPRNRGAGLFADEYAGMMGGTLVTRFVRIPISILHWKIVSLTLNGAIS